MAGHQLRICLIARPDPVPAGNTLETEGPDDHFAEERIANTGSSHEEIHLFHRMRHHTDFTYKGRMKLLKLEARSGTPSHFKYQVL